MRLLLEDRVEKAFRYLQPNEAEKVALVLNKLEAESFEDLKTHFQIHKLQTPEEQVFVLRVTPRLRILFKYGEEQTLVIEDIVSHEILEKFFKGGRR